MIRMVICMVIIDITLILIVAERAMMATTMFIKMLMRMVEVVFRMVKMVSRMIKMNSRMGIIVVRVVMSQNVF